MLIESLKVKLSRKVTFKNEDFIFASVDASYDMYSSTTEDVW